MSLSILSNVRFRTELKNGMLVRVEAQKGVTKDGLDRG